MPSSLSVIRDLNTISFNWEYEYDQSRARNELPSKLIGLLSRKFTNSAGVPQEDTFSEIKIPIESIGKVNNRLMVRGNILNPIYYQDLQFRLRIEWASGIETIQKTVLNDATYEPEPIPNPIGYPQLEENAKSIPPPPPIQNNEVVVEPSVKTRIFALIQANLVFKRLDFNKYSLFENGDLPASIHNESFNLINNSRFTTNTNNIPAGVSVLSNDLIITSKVKKETTFAGEDLNSLIMLIRNPNFISAFNNLILDFGEFDIPDATPYLTFSAYSTQKGPPSSHSVMVFEYLDFSGNFISSYAGPELPLTGQWDRYSTTIDSIPTNADKVRVKWEFKDIDSSEILELRVAAPQLETNHYATAYFDGNRFNSSVRVNDILFSNPCYLSTTVNLKNNALGTRGLFDNTILGKSGIQWFIQNNQVYFRYFDSLGFAAVNYSVGLVFNELLNLGVAFDKDKVSFYQDQNLVNEFPIPEISVGLNNPSTIGSLYLNNTALGCDMYNFGITQRLP